MGRYRTLEHTADVGLEAWGESLPGLFENMGRGLFSALLGLAVGSAGATTWVELRSGDFPGLLVDWLNELLYIFEGERFAPASIYVAELEPYRLRAGLRGVHYRPGEVEVRRGVKAATLHGVRFERLPGGRWYARVFFDV